MRAGRDRGQATVEFALIIPLVLIGVLAVVQMSLIAYAQLAVTHLAREAARTLAVDSMVDLDDFVDKLSTLETDGLVIEAHFETEQNSQERLVVVRISYQSSAIIGLFEPFSDHFTVSSEAIMLAE